MTNAAAAALDSAASARRTASAYVMSWRGVRKEFGRHVALRGVDLNVARGEILALVGPNGAGKTTLLRIGAALGRASSGDVEVGGEALDTRARARIGYLGHATLLYSNLTSLENLLFYARVYGVARPRERALELLERAGVARRANDSIARLSRGTQQRVAICRAFLHDPEILLLDEPFTGLDPHGTALLKDWLRERVAGGGAAVMTTHDLGAALDVATRFAVLAGGRVVGERAAAGMTLADLGAYYDGAVAAAATGAPVAPPRAERSA
ncbi:MAG: heme ABC exporter ATP-binding protein CcmA [bacterium]